MATALDAASASTVSRLAVTQTSRERRGADAVKSDIKRRRTAVESDIMKERLRAIAGGEDEAEPSDSDSSTALSETFGRPSMDIQHTDLHLLCKWLKQSPVFEGMSDGDLSKAAGTLRQTHVAAGEVIIRQGDTIDLNSRLFLLREGQVRVTADGGRNSPVITQSAGWVFGEVALLFRSARTATVTAVTECVVYWMGREALLTRVLRHAPGARRLLFLRKVPLLKGLSDNMLVQAAAHMHERTFQPGEFLVRQRLRMSECEDDVDLFVIRHGRVRVVTTAAGIEASVGRGHIVGQRTLVTGRLRAGDCIADGTVEVLSVPGKQFDSMQNPLMSCMLDYDAISEVMHASNDILNLRQDQFDNIVEEFEREELVQGQCVIKRGDVIRRLYVVREGAVQTAGPLSNAGGFTYFGGFTRAVADYDVTIASSHAVLLTCSESVIGCLPDVQQVRRRSSVSFADLQPLRLVGVGNSGHVQLVMHRESGIPYALKAVYKGSVKTIKNAQHLNNERLLLERVTPHRFCVGFVAAYQDNLRLYLLQEWMPGGELFKYVQTRQRLPEPTAAFYGANVLLAITHLHSIGIIHRDIKPENLLLDARGYCKLADFGFAKRVGSDRTFTICGTPDYQAPEIIERTGTSMPADMWALGILLYEMLVGDPPFMSNSDDPWDTYARIIECRYTLPKYLSVTVRNLISQLLRKNPVERLTAAQARTHPWFNQVDFDALLAGTAIAPIQPMVKSAVDADNYDNYETIPPVPAAGRASNIHEDWKYWRRISQSIVTSPHSPGSDYQTSSCDDRTGSSGGSGGSGGRP